jgi:hypothetical protein
VTHPSVEIRDERGALLGVYRYKVHNHKRLTSKSTSTVNTDDSVTVLEVCRCGAHRNVIVANGRAERTEWK